MDASQNAFNVIVGLDIAFGLLLCFFGYLISKVRIVFGLILGCMWGANIGFAISQNPWMAIAVGIVGGLLGAALSVAFYLMALFLIGAFLGGFLGGTLSTFMTHTDPNPFVVFISAVFTGSLVLFFKRLRTLVTILATSLGGSGFVAFGVLCFFLVKSVAFTTLPDMLSQHGNLLGYGILLGWIVLAAAGFAIQYRFLPPDPEKIRMEKQMDSAATSWDGDSSKL